MLLYHIKILKSRAESERSEIEKIKNFYLTGYFLFGYWLFDIGHFLGQLGQLEIRSIFIKHPLSPHIFSRILPSSQYLDDCALKILSQDAARD